MRIHPALIALLVLGACASARGHGPDAEVRAETMVVEQSHIGTVRVVGSPPVDVQVVLETGTSASLRVEGPLRAEIGRLAGAEVEVDGHTSDNTFHATGYRVRSVDGRPVVSGTVEASPGGGLQLRTEDCLLIGLAGADGVRIGQKIWVQGQSTLQVQSYGVIRP
jgi:hypothetical protein